MTRVENAFITRSIIVGSRSKKIDDPNCSHEWSCYIRPAFAPLNYIQNVTFKLHETFTNNTISKEYPFEIFERGWGEFTIQIKIIFVDPNERPVNLTHYLVLHGTEVDGYVVSERIEEIVFKSPTKLMHSILQKDEEKDDTYKAIESQESLLIESAIESMIARVKDLEK